MTIPTVASTNIKAYDWLDFGASKPASLDYGRRHLFGKKGLGIDLDPERVQKMIDDGYECVIGDLTKIKLPAKSVRFVKMAHILEHMPNLAAVKKVLDIASRASTEFLVITGPYFDAEEYLAKQGMKLHWSDYPDHPCHLTVKQLVKILDALGLGDYEVYLRDLITDSTSPHIHPLKSPPWSHLYDPKKHPPKAKRRFDQPVWTDFVCYVRLGQAPKWTEITQAYPRQVPYIFKNAKGKVQMPEAMQHKMAELIEAHKLQGENISQLKKNSAQLRDQLVSLRQQRTAEQRSKAHTAARQMQRVAFASRHPAKALRKIRGQIRL